MVDSNYNDLHYRGRAGHRRTRQPNRPEADRLPRNIYGTNMATEILFVALARRP